MTETRKLAAILAADIVGYSRLMGQDEAATVHDLKAHQAVVFPLIAQHDGNIIDTAGDGILAQFSSVVRAVECAIAIQQIMAQRNIDVAEDRRMHFRIGVNLGDIIDDGTRIYGDGVNIAARIEGLSDPGGIFISRAAADQVRDKMPIQLESRGSQSVKNIARSIEVFKVICGLHEIAKVTEHSAVDRAPLRSIAVLAFNNMSADAEQEYFSDGISEDIITDLSKIADLRVIARNSSFVYKNKPISIPEVARELSVGYVLEGSVRRSGSRIRVNAQLIEGTTGVHVWASRYDRDLTDIFAVQDELTREIVGALRLKLSASERERLTQARPVNIEAYELLLRGREQAWAHTRSGNIAALATLERAVSVDPDCAAAQARMAFVHVIDYVNGWSSDPERSLQTGLSIATRVVDRAPDESDGHYALAVASIWNRDLDRALREGARCLALSPSSAEGHLSVAHAQLFYGNPIATLQTLDAYMRLDPLFPEIALYFLAQARYSLGEFELAAAALEQRLQRNPDSETSYALLASCLGQIGRVDEARRAWDQVFRINPAFSVDRRRRILPFKNVGDFERRVDGLRKAGIVV